MSACGDTDRSVGMDLDVSSPEMDQVTVTTKTDSSDIIMDGYSYHEETLTVDSAKRMTIRTYVEMDFGGEPTSDECENAAELEEADYQTVVTAVIMADLMNYQPPAEEGCEPMAKGWLGCEIEYRSSAGEEASFDTGPCALEEEIQHLKSIMTDLALKYSLYCLDDEGPEEGDVSDGGGRKPDDERPVVYDVPIVNPRTLPRPILP